MDERDYKAMNEELNQPSCLGAVSGSLLSDDDIKQYFSWGYGGDSGSAIFGATWAKNTVIQEIERRQQMIISEPDGIVRETMIANLLVGLQ
jgi:hypothetical protein